MKNSTNISLQENNKKHYLFEEDPLSVPVECFLFDASKEIFPVKPHWHYYIEIIYVLDGPVVVYVSGEQYLLQSRELILLHPKAVHSIYASGSTIPQYAVLKFDINRLTLTPNYAPKIRSIFRLAEKRKMKIQWDVTSTAILV